ncbi:MAG TPA: acyl-CoA dehydrogenase family protein [Methylomirabilota bacterium]|nr:acyl-CoA dehydrogenase family protein [Methylomirabilota bacterium]
MTATRGTATLSDEIIGRCGDRAAAYDRENRFFTEDFEELRAAGYLKMAIPEDLGGPGMTLADVCREQRRLAYRAPATALATNMHLYWTGVAADMRRTGDKSLEWLLREAAAGEVFAAGHGEAGNDLPLFLSTARAERGDGGYRFWGHKTFGSLAPVWTRLGLHAMDSSDPKSPKVIHAFMSRATKDYAIKETWDTLGMRATRSDDTILEGAFIPDKYVARVLPAGTADLFVLSIFGWAEPTFGSIYLGLAERARDIAIAGVKKRTALALTRSMAYHPEVQHCFSEMQLALEAAGAQVDRVAEDWSKGVDHGAQWPMKLVAAKHNAVEAAKKVVDLAMAVSGGAGMFKSNELERLYRDARCGGFHPANSLLVHEIVGKTVLGIDLGEQPRWG